MIIKVIYAGIQRWNGGEVLKGCQKLEKSDFVKKRCFYFLTFYWLCDKFKWMTI